MNKNLLTLFIAICTLSACDSTDKNYDLVQEEVNFISTIGEGPKTRATGTTWDTNDAIGIYMVNAGQPLSATSIVKNSDNRKYNTTGNGIFKASTEDQTISFSNSSVDFVAYYPFESSITDFKYAIDVADQSVSSAIDFMYSKNAKAQDGSNPNVNLIFHRQLAKLVFNIQTGIGIDDITNLATAITGMNTKAEFDLSTGSLVVNNTSKQKIDLFGTNTTTSSIVEAIILPSSNNNNVKVAFAVDGETYFWNMPSTSVFSAGKRYTYNVVLQNSGVSVLDTEGTIEDWQNESTENIVVDKEGTYSNPFSIASAKQNAGANGKWVKGFIVGSTTATYSNDVDMNILLADKADETNPDNFFAVDLTSNPEMQAALNIVDNPTLIGVEVKVKGDILSTVLGTAVGMKNVVAQEGGKEVEFEVIFLETFGVEDAAKIKIANFSNWDMKSPIIYSDEYGVADIRNVTNLKLSSHLWLESGKNTSLKIDGIDAGYTNVTLSYNITSNKINGNTSKIVVECDGVALTNIPSIDIPVSNTYETISVSIPDNTTSIRFYSSSTVNTDGYRIDNIELKRKK